MPSRGLLLLLGLLTLWAEMTPISGQDRPGYCYLRHDPGPCRGYFPHFYYNPASNQCEIFIYGGCEGNANNFRTKNECQRTCVASPMRRLSRIGTAVRT